jgi:phosphate-selective porin OprO and OprP
MLEMLQKIVAAFLTAAACLLPVTSSAQDSNSFARENQELRSRLDRLESFVDQLRLDASTTPSFESGISTIPTTENGPVAGRSVEHTSFSTWNLHSALEGPPTFPTVRLTGFFQADAGWIHQDAVNMAAVGDVQDGTDFRRARLAATGNVAENVGYMLEMDFAFPGRPSFMDVWGEVRDLDVLQNVRFGQYRQPFGLDGLTSVKELTFLERGLPFAFLPFRQMGVMAHGTDAAEAMTWWLSGFRAPVDTFAGNVGDNGGYGLASRVTGVVMDDGAGSILHVGGAYSLIEPSSGTVRYRNQPEFFVSDSILGATPFFVDTLAMATDHVNLFGGELAATSGAWHAQGEVIYAVVDRSAASTATFSGASIQTGYILTGEHRPYDGKNGVLGLIVPHENFGNSCAGAWEVAARWSYLDLNYGGIVSEPEVLRS